MGASDKAPKWEVDGVSQELVVNVIDASDEEQVRIKEFLIKNGVEENRFVLRWDTWKGLYVTPPFDVKPWGKEELYQIETLLKRLENVIGTDYSEGAGSQG